MLGDRRLGFVLAGRMEGIGRLKQRVVHTQARARWALGEGMDAWMSMPLCRVMLFPEVRKVVYGETFDIDTLSRL